MINSCEIAPRVEHAFVAIRASDENGRPQSDFWFLGMVKSKARYMCSVGEFPLRCRWFHRVSFSASSSIRFKHLSSSKTVGFNSRILSIPLGPITKTAWSHPRFVASCRPAWCESRLKNTAGSTSVGAKKVSTDWLRFMGIDAWGKNHHGTIHQVKGVVQHLCPSDDCNAVYVHVMHHM